MNKYIYTCKIGYSYRLLTCLTSEFMWSQYLIELSQLRVRCKDKWFKRKLMVSHGKNQNFSNTNANKTTKAKADVWYMQKSCLTHYAAESMQCKRHHYVPEPIKCLYSPHIQHDLYRLLYFKAYQYQQGLTPLTYLTQTSALN